ncbi:MAG: hypothetical protein ACT4PN_09715 [Nitrospiraceae bacterium]
MEESVRSSSALKLTLDRTSKTLFAAFWKRLAGSMDGGIKGVNGISAMATNATEERFRIVNEFIGFGVLHAPIWFIGIEEAGTWGKHPEDEQQQYDKYACRWFPAEEGEVEREAKDKRLGYTKIYDIMSKLMVAITNPNRDDFEGWKEFRNKKLFQLDGITFQANLFPLGKSSTSNWPDHYRNVFGLGEGRS